MASENVRQYTAHAESTSKFGRVLCSTRDQHMVVDGPVQNGCPGEAATPGELFLGSVACCGVELLQVLAKDQGVPLNSVRVAISGTLDRSKQAKGVTPEQGGELIKAFKGR